MAWGYGSARCQSLSSELARRWGSIRCGGSKWWRSANVSMVRSGKIAANRSAIRRLVVGVAAAAEREVDRPLERSGRFEVEVAVFERVDEGAQTGGPLGHPRGRWAFWSGRRLDARR